MNRISLIVLFFSILLVGCANTQTKKYNPSDNEVHSCISVGYAWCEAKQKCVKTSEDKCGSVDNTGACTQEARLCPDGSSVGRTGSNCEFAPCPQANKATGIGIANPASNFLPSEWRSIEYHNRSGRQPKRGVRSAGWTDLR